MPRQFHDSIADHNCARFTRRKGTIGTRAPDHSRYSDHGLVHLEPRRAVCARCATFNAARRGRKRTYTIDDTAECRGDFKHHVDLKANPRGPRYQPPLLQDENGGRILQRARGAGRKRFTHGLQAAVSYRGPCHRQTDRRPGSDALFFSTWPAPTTGKLPNS